MAQSQQATQADNSIGSFEEQLSEYANSASLGRDDSILLRVADDFRSGAASSDQIQAYKAAALQHISSHLQNDEPQRQRAFIQFLLQSEMLNEAAEIRNALYTLLQDGPTPLDALSLNIISALLQSHKPPSVNIARNFLARIRAEYRAAPDWRYVGILAALVARSSDAPYTVDNLVSDISALSNTQSFERKLVVRNALWASLTPRLDAITIITRIRQKQPPHSHNYPITPDISNNIKRFEDSVVSS